MINTKVHKTYNLILKIAIIILAYWGIYREILVKHEWNDIVNYFSQNYTLTEMLLPLLGILLMMVINWGAESVKWKFLIKKQENINLWASLRGVFSGVTISSLTPNRIGEYFGRVFVLNKTHPVRGILMTIVGSFSQLLVTLTIGGIALSWMLIRYPDWLNVISSVSQIFIVVPGILIIFVLLGLYFNLGIISIVADKLTRKWPKVNRFANVFTYYNTFDLLNVFLFSLFRYAIFSLQFYFLMRLFNLHFSFIDSYLIISMIFLGITVIPSVALAELGVRGSVAIFVVNAYLNITTIAAMPNSELNIIATTTVLWLFNIIIPSIVGSLFIFKLRFFKINNNNG